MGKARFGTTQAGVIGPRFTRLAIPQDAIARSPSHGATATHLVKQTATAFAKAAVDLFGKAHDVGTARLDKIGEKGFGAVVIVDHHIADPARRDGDQDSG